LEFFRQRRFLGKYTITRKDFNFIPSTGETMLNYTFMLHALIGALLSGMSLAVISPFVTLKKISYMGEALSHIAFAGIALALLLGLNLSLTTLVFVILVAGLIGLISRLYKIEESNVITIFLSVAMALGIVLITLKKDYSFDLASYLFGNVLLVNVSDIWQLIVLLFVNVAYVTFFFKELFYLTYNMTLAEVFGIKVKPVYYGFMMLLALNIVVVVKIAGIILVTAQLVLPASIAFRFTKKLKTALILSILVSFLSSLSGFYLSWWFNLPTGAVIVLTQFIVYILSLTIRKHIVNWLL
jgi:zinc transport system permease protein